MLQTPFRNRIHTATQLQRQIHTFGKLILTLSVKECRMTRKTDRFNLAYTASMSLIQWCVFQRNRVAEHRDWLQHNLVEWCSLPSVIQIGVSQSSGFWNGGKGVFQITTLLYWKDHNIDNSIWFNGMVST